MATLNLVYGSKKTFEELAGRPMTRHKDAEEEDERRRKQDLADKELLMQAVKDYERRQK